MSEETESDAVLRKSLDAIDRLRRRLMGAGYLTVAGTIGAFLWVDHVIRTSRDINSVAMAAVLALTCVIGWSTFALAIFMARMTKRVLRAVDLASTKLPARGGGMKQILAVFTLGSAMTGAIHAQSPVGSTLPTDSEIREILSEASSIPTKRTTSGPGNSWPSERASAQIAGHYRWP